jgi:hypothetical protein
MLVADLQCGRHLGPARGEIAIERNSTIIFPAQCMDTARVIAQYVDRETVAHERIRAQSGDHGPVSPAD